MLASCTNCMHYDPRVKKCAIGRAPEDGLLCSDYLITQEFKEGLVRKIKEDVFKEINLAALSKKIQKTSSPMICM